VERSETQNSSYQAQVSGTVTDMGSLPFAVDTRETDTFSCKKQEKKLLKIDVFQKIHIIF